MANERLAKGPEDGPDYTETNGASWLPGFTCGGREGKVEGEEAEAASEAEEMSSRAGFTRMLSFWKLMGPLIVRYKLARKLPKGEMRDEELERLHDKCVCTARHPARTHRAPCTHALRARSAHAPRTHCACTLHASCTRTHPPCARQVRPGGAAQHPWAARPLRQAGTVDLDRSDGA